jgi:hypothetical protein
MEFDEQKADHILTYALALYPAETVCFEIMLKGLGDIGDRWYRDEATVQQEHFVSELATRRLEAMVAASPTPTRAGRILTGCAPEDVHAFVPLLVTFMLKQRGWDVVYLGARVPVGRLEATVRKINPRLVILTAQQLDSAASLLDTGRLLQGLQVPLGFGGRIFNLLPELHHHVPGHILGEQLHQVPQAVERLLATSAPWPPTRQASEGYQRALASFQEHRVLIEAEVLRKMGSTDIAPSHLNIANDEISRNIIAALQLGNIDFLCTDIEWVEGLLESHRVPRNTLGQYLKVYQQAAQEYLDGTDEIVVRCLAELNKTEAQEENELKDKE